jgi:pectate lyase
MKKQLLFVMLAIGTLCSQGCAKKAYPATSSTHLLQGTWRLKTTEGIETSTTGATKPLVTKFTLGQIVDVWTATTVEEYTSGKSLATTTYTIAGNTVTLKTAQGQARTGQLVTLTKGKLEIAWAENTTLNGSPGTSTVICTYVK